MGLRKNNKQMQNEIPKKSRQELKLEKQLNQSLCLVPKATQASMQLISIEPNSGVFHKNHSFVKIGIVSGFEQLTDVQRVELSKYFAENMNIRMRITSIFSPQSNTTNHYLSLFVVGDSYASAKNDFDTAESVLMSSEVRKFGIEYRQIITNEALAIIKCLYGNMDSYDFTASLRSKKTDWSKILFTEMDEKDDYFVINGKYTSCYIAGQYPSSSTYFLDKVKEYNCPIFSFVDIQPIDNEIRSMFERNIETKYNRKVEYQDNPLSNITFVIGFAADSNDVRGILEKALVNFLYKEGIILDTSVMRETKIFNSICTLGIEDFHANRNINSDMICNFIL